MNNDYTAVIRAIKRKLQKIYGNIEKDLRELAKAIIDRFESQIKELNKRIENGDITQASAKNQIAIMFGSVGIPEIREMAKKLHEANAQSEEEMQSKIPVVIAEALNREEYEIETELGEDAGLAPVSEEDVAEWIDEDENLFDPGEIDEERDVDWNETSIRKFFQTGIMLGLSASALLTYIVTSSVDRNRESFFRRVFDVISGANEEGRQLAMDAAASRGVEIQKQWVATHDFKTRDAHRELDGQRVPEDEAFKVDGEEIRFPRDPQAKAYLRCNCRCAMHRTRAKWRDTGGRRENIRDENRTKPINEYMRYPEWYAMKQQQLGQEEIDRIIKEMKREQARKAYRKRKKKLKAQKRGGG